MKKFIQWWMKGTGFGGNIKLSVSIVMLIFVVIFQSTQSYQSQSNNNDFYYDDSFYQNEYDDCGDNNYDAC